MLVSLLIQLGLSFFYRLIQLPDPEHFVVVLACMAAPDPILFLRIDNGSAPPDRYLSNPTP